MNVAVRIQHHPSRAGLLPGLLARLEGFEDVEVVTDPGGRRPDSWRTHRLCLESLPETATHLLVVQDDAAPCDDFPARALEAIREQPARIVCFFAPGFGHVLRRVELVRRQGARFAELPVGPFVPVVTICYPAAVARAIPEFADRRKTGAGRADDGLVAAYVRTERLGALATVPSLVEHRSDVPSAMGMRTRPGQRHRVAALYAD